MTRGLMRLTLLAVSMAASGCLVLGLDRFYDEAAITFDERLLGSWKDADDNVTAVIERSEWRSYKIKFTHPIETGTLTAYLFKEGTATYLDLAPVRGQDGGSFMMPGHALVRVTIAPNELTVAPLAHEWFMRALAAKTLPAALQGFRSEREQIILAAPRAALRRWLQSRTSDDAAFGAQAVFQLVRQ
jgi:hypothetical protein